MGLNILLINPPVLGIHSPFKLSPTPPLGLALIAAALEEDGHNVSVLDTVVEAPNKIVNFKNNIEKIGLSDDDILSKIPSNVNVIGLSCMFTDNWLHTKHLIDKIGKAFSKVKIICGGEHFTALPQKCLEETECLTAGVIGEGDNVVKNLVYHFEHNINLKACAGIAYKEKKQIFVNKKNPRLKDINTTKPPAWHLFPLKKYELHNFSYGVNQGLTLPILATRGCPYECTFCSSPNMWGRQYNMRSTDYVINEIEFLHEKYNVKHFDFYDLTAILKRDWIIEFCEKLIAKNLNITWQIPAGTRAEVINLKVAKLLFQSGCEKITYAPESGSKRVLKDIKKRVKIKAMLQSIKDSHKAGINVKLNMIIGFPKETHLDIFYTWLFLIKCSWYGAYDALPGTFSAYPGTELFNYLVSQKKINYSEEFYFNVIRSSSITGSHNYSEKIGKNFIKFYFWFLIVSFYSSNYLFRPIRIINTISNLVTKKYNSRAEQALGRFLFR